MAAGTRSGSNVAGLGVAPALGVSVGVGVGIGGGTGTGDGGAGLPPQAPPQQQQQPSPDKTQLATLFDSFGLNAASVTELQDQQFETTKDFVDYNSDDFTALFKIFTKSPNAAVAPTVWINQKGRKKIIVLHAWVQNRVRLNIPYRAIEFTVAEMIAIQVIG